MKVVCVLKSGGDFHVQDVINLKTMLERNITVPYDFHCLTDIVDETPCGVPLQFDYKGWWSKIELFRPGLFDSEYIVYFDLDTIILGNIDDLLLQEEDFMGLKPFNPFRQRTNYLGSGILGWKNDGSFDFLFDEFVYDEHSKRFRGDQDYISDKLNEHNIEFTHCQNLVDGVYSYKRNVQDNGLPGDASIVCFHGSPRPYEVGALWIREALA